MLRGILTVLAISFSFVASAQFHANTGLYYNYLSGSAISGNFNLRYNFIESANSATSISLNPNVGLGFNSDLTDGLFTYYMLPLTAEYHVGVASHYDILIYRGYGFKAGGVVYNLAGYLTENNIKQGVLIGGDYKFQKKTADLRTYSVQLNLVYPFTGNLNHAVVSVGFNYHFGLY